MSVDSGRDILNAHYRNTSRGDLEGHLGTHKDGGFELPKGEEDKPIEVQAVTAGSGQAGGPTTSIWKTGNHPDEAAIAGFITTIQHDVDNPVDAQNNPITDDALKQQEYIRQANEILSKQEQNQFTDAQTAVTEGTRLLYLLTQIRNFNLPDYVSKAFDELLSNPGNEIFTDQDKFDILLDVLTDLVHEYNNNPGNVFQKLENRLASGTPHQELTLLRTTLEKHKQIELENSPYNKALQILDNHKEQIDRLADSLVLSAQRKQEIQRQMPNKTLAQYQDIFDAELISIKNDIKSVFASYRLKGDLLRSFNYLKSEVAKNLSDNICEAGGITRLDSYLRYNSTEIENQINILSTGSDDTYESARWNLRTAGVTLDTEDREALELALKSQKTLDDFFMSKIMASYLQHEPGYRNAFSGNATFLALDAKGQRSFLMRHHFEQNPDIIKSIWEAYETKITNLVQNLLRYSSVGLKEFSLTPEMQNVIRAIEISLDKMGRKIEEYIRAGNYETGSHPFELFKMKITDSDKIDRDMDLRRLISNSLYNKVQGEQKIANSIFTMGNAIFSGADFGSLKNTASEHLKQQSVDKLMQDPKYRIAMDVYLSSLELAIKLNGNSVPENFGVRNGGFDPIEKRAFNTLVALFTSEYNQPNSQTKTQSEIEKIASNALQVGIVLVYGHTHDAYRILYDANPPKVSFKVDALGKAQPVFAGSFPQSTLYKNIMFMRPDALKWIYNLPPETPGHSFMFVPRDLEAFAMDGGRGKHVKSNEHRYIFNYEQERIDANVKGESAWLYFFRKKYRDYNQKMDAGFIGQTEVAGSRLGTYDSPETTGNNKDNLTRQLLHMSRVGAPWMEASVEKNVDSLVEEEAYDLWDTLMNQIPNRQPLSHPDIKVSLLTSARLTRIIDDLNYLIRTAEDPVSRDELIKMRIEFANTLQNKQIFENDYGNLMQDYVRDQGIFDPTLHNGAQNKSMFERLQKIQKYMIASESALEVEVKLKFTAVEKSELDYATLSKRNKLKEQLTIDMLDKHVGDFVTRVAPMTTLFTLPEDRIPNAELALDLTGTKQVEKHLDDVLLNLQRSGFQINGQPFSTDQKATALTLLHPYICETLQTLESIYQKELNQQYDAFLVNENYDAAVNVYKNAKLTSGKFNSITALNEFISANYTMHRGDSVNGLSIGDIFSNNQEMLDLLQSTFDRVYNVMYTNALREFYVYDPQTQQYVTDNVDVSLIASSPGERAFLFNGNPRRVTAGTETISRRTARYLVDGTPGYKTKFGNIVRHADKITQPKEDPNNGTKRYTDMEFQKEMKDKYDAMWMAIIAFARKEYHSEEEIKSSVESTLVGPLKEINDKWAGKDHELARQNYADWIMIIHAAIGQDNKIRETLFAQQWKGTNEAFGQTFSYMQEFFPSTKNKETFSANTDEMNLIVQTLNNSIEHSFTDHGYTAKKDQTAIDARSAILAHLGMNAARPLRNFAETKNALEFFGRNLQQRRGLKTIGKIAEKIAAKMIPAVEKMGPRGGYLTQYNRSNLTLKIIKEALNLNRLDPVRFFREDIYFYMATVVVMVIMALAAAHKSSKEISK